MSLDQQVRQLLHLPPWSGAGHVFVVVDTVDVHGHQLGAGPLTLVADTLIIKFFGIISGSMHFSSACSRVGSQCLVSGVNLQTSNMFLRCAAPCRSPESCQRKYLWPVISVTMAAVHDPWSRARSLRAIARLVVLNLYRPFRA